MTIWQTMKEEESRTKGEAFLAQHFQQRHPDLAANYPVLLQRTEAQYGEPEWTKQISDSEIEVRYWNVCLDTWVIERRAKEAE